MRAVLLHCDENEKKKKKKRVSLVSWRGEGRREEGCGTHPVPTGPPIPTVKALSLKFLLRSGGALLVK